MVKIPEGVLLRRKDVLGMGLVSLWCFKRAVAEGRLEHRPIPGRTYARYRKDKVMQAFGWRPCAADGKPMEPIAATHVAVE